MFEFRVKRLVQLIIVIVLLAVLGRALYLYCSYKFNLMMGYSNDCRPKSNSRLNMEKSDWSNGGVFDCVEIQCVAFLGWWPIQILSVRRKWSSSPRQRLSPVSHR